MIPEPDPNFDPNEIVLALLIILMIALAISGLHFL
jgi:hypothetical protein